MKLTLVAKMEKFEAKAAGSEPVAKIALEGAMSYSEIGQLARMLGKSLVVSLTHQQQEMFEEEKDGYEQPGLFDEVDLPIATGPTCTKCGGELDELVWDDCGQRHRLGEKPAPVLCGLPARFGLTGTDSRGREIADIVVCDTHLEIADPERHLAIDDAPEGATCQWPLTDEEIAERHVDEVDPFCVCGHRLSCHNAPGEPCASSTKDGNPCECTLFRSAIEAAEGSAEEHEYSEAELEAAEIAEDSR